jgi:hypothetical protein
MCLSCEDFEGPCCDSCHEDAQEGYFDLMDIYRANSDKVFAIVCCQKSDEAQRRADA